MKDRTSLIEELGDYIGEYVHSSLRKLCDSPQSHVAWAAIRDVPTDEWERVVDGVATEVLRWFEQKGFLNLRQSDEPPPIRWATVL